jgi:hypothetical protein
MALYAMLTLDLNRNVSDEARTKFYGFLISKNWQRLKLTTTFWCTYSAAGNEQQAVQWSKTYVQQAASYAGITNYEAAVQVGTTAPAIWKQPL